MSTTKDNYNNILHATIPLPLGEGSGVGQAPSPWGRAGVGLEGLFPILSTTINGFPLVYLDNGATTQKPQSVIDAVAHYYAAENSNVHRGVHTLSQRATDAFEAVRKKVQRFINAAHEHEIIYTKGATESINLVAASFGRKFLQPGDSVLISAMEHHANIVPWQLICEERGAQLKVIPITETGDLDLNAFDSLLDDTVKLLAVTYVSNALGTVNPVQDIIRQAHAKNIPVLIDATQAVQHIGVDVQALDADFLVFSGHKMYGPTGVGILYGKEKFLNDMPPYQSGGEMIKTVTFEKTTFNELPFKFETGTPNIAGVIGLGAAIDFINRTGIDNIRQHEEQLLAYAEAQLQTVPGFRFIGTPRHRAAAISFLLEGAHPFDVGELLDQQGIAVRTGHHCCQPLMNCFGIPGTARASFAVYNTKEDVDRLVAGLKKAAMMLG